MRPVFGEQTSRILEPSSQGLFLVYTNANIFFLVINEWKVYTNAGHALVIWICTIEELWASKSAGFNSTVKLDFKELLIKEQIDFKELFTDYQLFYTINLLLNKELLPI